MTHQQVIEKTISFVQQELQGAEGGHDWFHIQRVYNNAVLIAATENVDTFIVALGALLHDIADAKFHNGDENVGPEKAKAFLLSLHIDQPVIDHVENIIRHISFKGGNFSASFSSPELVVVQDADRLDALGAIGIARAFHYGGFKDRQIYDPAVLPNLNMSREEYKHSNAPTINHFYEKLLLLKDKMNTGTGKRIAEQRHIFMQQYLDQFYNEWNGEK